jgi:AraC-like DNA-binding protein
LPSDRARSGESRTANLTNPLTTAAERTVRRQLGAEGTSFRKIEQQVRRERAEALLAEPGLTLTEIATSLGYWSESGFVRAFRRWHDTTPGRWRSASSARDP